MNFKKSQPTQAIQTRLPSGKSVRKIKVAEVKHIVLIFKVRVKAKNQQNQ